VTTGAASSSYDVRVWAVKTYQRSGGKTFGVRWSVAGRRQHRTFRSAALADSFRAELLTATRQGTPFDVGSGMPVTRQPAQDGPTWYEHACAFVDSSWTRLAPRSRQSIADVLSTVTPILLPDASDRPAASDIRAALYLWAFNTARRNAGPPEAKLAAAVAWVERNVAALSSLADLSVLRRVLDGLSVNISGKPAAATVIARRRSVLHSALRYGVEKGYLTGNPLDRLRWKAPRVAEAIDRRSVVNHDQAKQLLTAVAEQGDRGRRLVAFFGCMYYAAMRPAEVSELRETDLVLPGSPDKWGELHLNLSNPPTALAWTDAGTRAPRQLKHRAVREVRIVPCVPQLVRLLTNHLEEFGTAPDGRLFRAARGGPVPNAVYGQVWRQARRRAFTPAEAASPLAARPYDLRHAAVSTWLNAGTDPTLVAEWAGHSVHVLLKVYAKCVVGRDDVARRRIADMLSNHE